MAEHSLRPVCEEGEYIAYPAYARVMLKSGIKLDNKIDVISLPFCRTGDIHPNTCQILEKPSLVDLAWAGNSGVKETFDLSKVKYAAFSFSKCFGVQYHRIGIAYSKVSPRFRDKFCLSLGQPISIENCLNLTITEFNEFLSEKMIKAEKIALKNVGR